MYACMYIYVCMYVCMAMYYACMLSTYYVHIQCCLTYYDTHKLNYMHLNFLKRFSYSPINSL